jgi:hypothetical protein
LLKNFVEKIIFKLIQENIKVLSKGRSFTCMYKFSHEKIEVFLKHKNLTKKRLKILLIGRGLIMKRWKFYKDVQFNQEELEAFPIRKGLTKKR